MFVKNWGSLILLSFIAIVLLTLVALLLRAFYKEIKHHLYFVGNSIRIRFQKLQRKYGVLLSIFKKIKGSELSYSTDVVFELFCHFYEIHQKEMEHWGWDKQLFPDGRKEVSDLYKWIKKTRSDNYEESKNIISRDGAIEFFGASYVGFKFRFNSKGELVITPFDEGSVFVYQRMSMKLFNALYNLDTEKCMWIIERRKVFGF